MNIRSSFIPNSPKVERTKMSISRRTYRLDGGVSVQWNHSARKREWATDACTNPNFQNILSGERNQTQSVHSVEFHLCEFLRKGHWIYRKSTSVVAWGPVEGGLTPEGNDRTLEGWEKCPTSGLWWCSQTYLYQNPLNHTLNIGAF